MDTKVGNQFDHRSQNQPSPRVLCLYFLLGLEEKDFYSFAESCFRFTPVIALRGFEAIFLDLKGTQGLYRERDLILRLKALARRFGVEKNLVLSFAQNAPLAFSIAREQRSRLQSLSIKSVFHSFLNPFLDESKSMQDQERRLDRAIATFERLGVETLLDLSKIPTKSLSHRFGKQVALIHSWIQHGDHRPWKRFFPSQKLIEHTELSDVASLRGCESYDEILFSIKKTLDRVVSRLRARFMKATQIKLSFHLERYESIHRRELIRNLQIDLLVPQGSTRGLLGILKERFMIELSQKPFESPVVGLTVEISEMTPGFRAQKDFFSRVEAEQEEWEALWARVSSKIGKEQIFCAEETEKYLPEKAWRKLIDAYFLSKEKEPFSMGVRPVRPTRLLKEPLLLSWQVKESLFSTTRGRACSWKVMEFKGPERISGEWWEKAFFRDYYRVFVHTGQELWVFKNEKDFYLHGYFD